MPRRLTTLKPRVSSVNSRVDTRTASTERTRGRKWMDIRAEVLSRNPLCAHCQRAGLTAVATEVDHVIPLADGGTDAMLQGLCKPCHDAKSEAEAKRRARG